MATRFPAVRPPALLLLALLAASAGCAQVPRLPIPPEMGNTQLIDPDAPPPEPPADPKALPRLEEVIQASFREDAKGPPLNMLALSGGGMYGAFDVGVLNGWTASGKRPAFDVVTGISTGALISTFAFLGPQYDDFLRDAYVHISSADIFEKKFLPTAALFSDSLASSAPLKRKIDAAITPEVLRAVAKAHAAGRRLYVGTTNLDTRRLVVWDMGAIASRDTPEALELYRRVVLASASVPGFFPPVTIDVEIDGKTYHELHVDGGVSASVFLGAFMLKTDPHNLRSRAGSNLYVITSGKLFADAECVQPTVTGVSAAAISSMLYAASRSDLYRLFCLSLVTGVNFRLLAVPQDFPLNPNGLSFEPAEMARLFEEGRRLGGDATAWRRTPPGVEPGEHSLPRTGVRFVTEPDGRPEQPGPVAAPAPGR